VKYVCLNKIGATNWVPTVHISDIARGLDRFIYVICTKTKYQFGFYIFEQIVKHAKTMDVKMPIAFPSFLCTFILSQHPSILLSSDTTSPRKSPHVALQIV
jgi:hypothetical protein